MREAKSTICVAKNLNLQQAFSEMKKLGVRCWQWHTECWKPKCEKKNL